MVRASGGGRRPFLILTRTEAVPVLNQILAVPAARTIRGIPTEVPLDESDGGPTGGRWPRTTCRSSGRSLCTERITVLGAERLSEVCEALRGATAC